MLASQVGKSRVLSPGSVATVPWTRCVDLGQPFKYAAERRIKTLEMKYQRPSVASPRGYVALFPGCAGVARFLRAMPREAAMSPQRYGQGCNRAQQSVDFRH